MKYILLLLLSFNVFAGEFSFQIDQKSRISDEDIYQVSGWNGFQLSYMPEKSGYAFLSYETVKVAPRGQAFEYEMIGLGLGSKYEPFKNIRVFGQVGYYLIENSWGRKREFNEGLYYYINEVYGNGQERIRFDEYQVENDNAVGGTIGVEFNYPLSKSTSIGFVFSHRIMKIKETVSGMTDAWDYDRTGVRWERAAERDYSSSNFGINYIYTF